VLLDGGALLFKHGSVSPAKMEQSKITAEGIVEAYNAMGFSAVGIAEQDLTAGIPFLQKMAQKARFDWLSANLVNEADGQPLFMPSKIIPVGKINMALIGLTDEMAGKHLSEDSKVKIIPWNDVLPELVQRMSKKADIVVLLSSYALAKNKKISEAIPGINLVISSGKRPRNTPPTLYKNTLFLQTASKGKYHGTLDIHWHPSHIWKISRASEYKAKKDSLKHMREQVRRSDKKEKEYGFLTKNKGAQKAYDFMQKRIPVVEKEIAALEIEVKNDAGKEKNASMYTNTFTALKKAMPDEPQVLNIVSKINNQIEQIQRTTKSQKKSYLPFTGWYACRKCHPKQTEAWRLNRHAMAFNTLRRNNQNNNRDCIACHVTSITTGDEPHALSLPASLRVVGCESCHGPGENHIKDPQNKPMPQKPVEETCLSCHTPEQDDAFNYQGKIKKLGCLKNKD